MYQVKNHQTRPAPGGTVNFGYHESKTGKNVVTVQATDIRKGTGFDKVQYILQNNDTKSCVMIHLVQNKNYHQKLYGKLQKKFTKNLIRMHFRTGTGGHLSPKYLWIKVLRTLEIHQITNAF